MNQIGSEIPLVKLRPLEYKDLGEFLKIRNAVADMLHNNSRYSLNECREWFVTTSIEYFVVETDALGLLGYFRVNSQESHDKRIEIGLDLNPKYQGRKWSKSIYKCFVEEVLAPNEIEYVTLRVLKKNLKAINLYLSVGFRVTNETELDWGMEISLKDLISKLDNSVINRSLVSE